MPINAVIFDIGNVLIEWQPERYFAYHIGEERTRAMFSEVDIHSMMNRIDAGHAFDQVVEGTAQAHADWHDAIMMIRDNWADVASPAIPLSVHLLRQLRTKGIPVFALSNFGAENFPVSVAKYPFLEEFDRHYISGQMGMIKPDAAIYAAVEADCGLSPDTLLFTDDRHDNIAAAQARGWQTHLFDGPEGWAHCLVKQGLLTKDEAQ
ncbi:HAD family phosphatase [Roseovarius sp. A21]|uniref:HAD family phosphatase n=1 Tax=Roseovarius bejariae TaxID=2576383 RepID=A0A844CYX8_9RHOB|nr:HAD family phosphatase [Roseovarius bejariae]MRU15830.1 HAD family phosphatase [Roseovarius bejariae]